MNCKEVQREISSFLRDETDRKKIKEFIEHLEECPSCQEEISIQYLVEKGLERLEEGSTFDLTRELENKMEAAKRKVHIYDSIKSLIAFLGIIIILCIFFFWLVKVIV